MLKKRDAEGLPVQIIILAVIALIVLVVVMAIFGKETGRSVRTLESCGSRGGNCVDTDKCTDGTKIPEIQCGDSKICCVRV